MTMRSVNTFIAPTDMVILRCVSCRVFTSDRVPA
jgi:hypothetical protein